MPVPTVVNPAGHGEQYVLLTKIDPIGQAVHGPRPEAEVRPLPHTAAH